MPTTGSGKAIASRNATTHGLFSRDVVLPALGEDPTGYALLGAEGMKRLPPRTLLERHSVEKIAAASSPITSLDPQALAASKASEAFATPASPSPAPQNWGGGRNNRNLSK